MDTLVTRLKSFAWRAGALAFVAFAGYILNLGTVWTIDPKALTDVVVIAVLGLATGEVTKYLNS